MIDNGNDMYILTGCQYMKVGDMGKRSNFERNPRDFYRTPVSAVEPLIPHLPPGTTFDEPCAGDGALIDALTEHGMKCVGALDIEPGRNDIGWGNMFEIRACFGHMFITNPPWSEDILNPIIVHLSKIAPTWLLFHADWMHTLQARTYLPSCVKIVSVGRVKWIPDSKHTSLDNVCWYLFDWSHDDGPKFYGR